MKALAALAALAAVAASAAAGPAPRSALRPERIVLRTDAGDLVLALYAAAPRHAAKVLSLMKEGAYDTAPIFKIDRARFVHVGGVARRRVRLPGARLKAISKLPLEAGAGAHRAGVLSMAHDPGDPDRAETSFIILLEELPALNGAFTAFGEVVGGQDVLAAMKAASVDFRFHPLRPLEVRSSRVYPTQEAAAAAVLRGPDRRALGLEDQASDRRVLLIVAALALTAGAALSVAAAELGRTAASIGLLAVLTGFFALFAALAGAAASSPWISVPLFAATAGLFRLMSSFER